MRLFSRRHATRFFRAAEDWKHMLIGCRCRLTQEEAARGLARVRRRLFATVDERNPQARKQELRGSVVRQGITAEEDEGFSRDEAAEIAAVQ